jgi:hypothetical protein
VDHLAWRDHKGNTEGDFAAQTWDPLVIFKKCHNVDWIFAGQHQFPSSRQSPLKRKVEILASEEKKKWGGDKRVDKRKINQSSFK